MFFNNFPRFALGFDSAALKQFFHPKNIKTQIQFTLLLSTWFNESLTFFQKQINITNTTQTLFQSFIWSHLQISRWNYLLPIGVHSYPPTFSPCSFFFRFFSRGRPRYPTHWPVYGWGAGEMPSGGLWWLEALDPGFCLPPAECWTWDVWTVLLLPSLISDLQGGREAAVRYTRATQSPQRKASAHNSHFFML